MKKVFLVPFVWIGTTVAAFGAGSAPTLGAITVVGDSLSAGYQNFTLLACQQPHGYANLVVSQAVSSGFASSRLLGPPLGSPSSVFAFQPLIVGGLGQLGVVTSCPPDPNPICPAPGRVDYTKQVSDLAIPGQTVIQAVTMRPVFSLDFPNSSEPDPAKKALQVLTNFILGFPGVGTGTAKSQVEWANELNSDTVIVWLGSNDVLGLFEGIQPAITDPLTFAKNYDQLLSSLARNHRRIIVANVPDVTVTPFMVGILPTLAKNDPLIALKLKADVVAYNLAIAVLAAKYHAPVVDIWSLVNHLAASGFQAGSQKLTTQANGGLFSTDNIHPSNSGYAIIANAFINTINQAYGTNITPVDVVSIANDDPLTPFFLKRDGMPAFCAVPANPLH